MNKKITLAIIFLLLSLIYINIYSQDTLWNQKDDKGLKQGYWKSFYDNGKIKYIGYFKDNKPLGEMKRYYEDGTLLAIQYFYKNSEYSYTKLFYNNGHIAAEGKYINTLKDSTWRYYSFYDKTLRLEENYTKGKKQGVSTKYYPNGKPAEIITWKDDIKNGQWLQFFENGQLKLKAFYINDKRSGDFNTYWPNGKNETIGKFENNLMEGEWKYFDEEGNQKIKVIYKNGVAQNPEAIEKAQKEIFELIEKNKGKIPEPKEEDLLPMQ